MEVSPVQLLIFQPTPFCNLNCTYCYLPDRQNRRVIDVEIVRKTVQRLREEELLDPALSIIWHAGEPTVVRRERYAEYFAAIKEVLGNSCEVVHHFQTNATLIEDKWCDFIREHQIAIGVSVDGPEFVHDHFRKSWSGRGTLDKTLRGIKALQEHEIEFHTISVISDRSLDRGEEIYNFLVSLRPCLLAFNVIIDYTFTKCAKKQSSSAPASPDQRSRLIRVRSGLSYRAPATLGSRTTNNFLRRARLIQD
jgi:uncharacterized protein